jgi:hypothetical protein
MWRAYFKKWEAVTRLSLDLPLLELMPELQKYVPPAKVMDKPVYSAFSIARFTGNYSKSASIPVPVENSNPAILMM